MSGWSGFFGSISPRRGPILALYAAQATIFLGVVALATPGTASEMAVIFAVLQILQAVVFWVLLAWRPRSRKLSNTVPGEE
jgi:hypothetical protein